MRGKDANDFCMVRCLRWIKDSSLANVIVKVRKRQSPDIILGLFSAKQQGSHVFDQLESPLCVLAFLGALLHNVKFFNFPLDCHRIRFRTQ